MLPTEWFPLLFLLLMLLQDLPGTGEIQLTLLDATQTPLPQTLVHFVTENQVPLASCTTDAAGRCTLLIQAAPTDAAGLIRGSLHIEGHGTRPVIWPGGPLVLTLSLDETGELRVGHDVYATRIPARPSPTTAALSTKTPGVGGSVEEHQSTQGSTPGNTLPGWRTCLLSVGLMSVFVVGAFLYGWTSTRGGLG